MLDFQSEIRWTADDLRKKMIRYQSDGRTQAELRHSYCVPLGWSEASKSVFVDNYEYLSVFRDPSCDLCEIAVDASVITRDISPVDFFRMRMKEEGCSLVQERMAHSISGDYGDMLYRRCYQGTNILSRISMIKDSNHLFRITCSVPEEKSHQNSEEFVVSLASFSLVNPTNIPVAEGLDSHQSVTPFIIRHFYPQSWVVFDVRLESNRSVWRLDNWDSNSGSCAGRIYLHAERGAVGSMNRKYEDFCQKIGMSLGVKENFHVFESDVCDWDKYWDRDGFNEFEQHVAQTSEHEVRTMGMFSEEKELGVFIALASPSSQSNHEWWAINSRAFQIVGDSLRAIR